MYEECVSTHSESPQKSGTGRLDLAEQLGSKKEFLPAQQAKQHAERLVPAVHMSCFAQLRAETSENDARDALGKPKNQKFHLLGAPVDEHFHFGKIRWPSTLKFNTTPVKPAENN